METVILERGSSLYLVNSARIARTPDDVASDFASSVVNGWEIDRSSPFITWIAGDFVQAGKPNQNTQYWTANDLEIADYSIKYAPLNMVHKYRTPVGFFAATKQVKPKAKTDAAMLDTAVTALDTTQLTIQALAGLWSHIFPFETAQVETAEEGGKLFFSMECRGTHLTCAGPDGCGETYPYMDVTSHCEHLLQRSSVRHIVNPTFRGGALIIPPTNPGWKDARAGIVTDAVMQEAAKFAEQNEAAFSAVQADGSEITPAGWEQLMALVLSSSSRYR